MRFVALVSGGKDSIYSMLQCIQNGHELVACVHLGAPATITEESYMYQTAASEVVRTLVQDCLRVPLILHQRVGTSVQTGLVYQNDNSAHTDEVEDLFLALQQAKEQFENVQAVSSGAILSTYQRVRIENVCSRLGLTSFSYLWRLAPQNDLLPTMLQDGIEAVVVRVACPPGLVPRKHLGKTLRFLSDIGLLQRLNERFQFHVCGEGGEYESLVIDSPLHQQKLVLDEVEIDETDDGVGNLRILKCHAEPKGPDDIPIWEGLATTNQEETKESQSASYDESPNSQWTKTPEIIHLPQVRQGTGGLLHVGEIMAGTAAAAPTGDSASSEAQLAVQESQQIFSILSKTLVLYGGTPQDVIFVHLYLSEISHFANINASYQQFFGTLLPPSRSCVAVGPGVLPGGRRVLLDCMVQLGSGAYMRGTVGSSADESSYAVAANSTKTSKVREVLHVQSISHWAPVCVGPYSQVNTIRSGLQFLAGQIGLIPATMQLQPTWTLQLEQCWKNVAAVLDALGGGSLQHLVSGLVYVSLEVAHETGSLATVRNISRAQVASNSSIVPGRIDSTTSDSELYGGYEDQGTWEALKAEESGENDKKQCPLLVVAIPEMPKGAIVEVEVIAATSVAASNLEWKDARCSMACTTKLEPKSSLGWDTGHGMCSLKPFNETVSIQSFVRSLGNQSGAMVLTTASAPRETMEGALTLNVESVLHDMLLSSSKVLAEARTGLGRRDAVHVRLFYVATSSDDKGGNVQVRGDGVQLRTSLQLAISQWGVEEGASTLAASVVPVHTMSIIDDSILFKEGASSPFLAMQALFYDPVHMETEVWIHKDREYATSLEL